MSDLSNNDRTCLSQVTELPFFASKVWVGRSGVEEVYPLGPLNEYERSVLYLFKKVHILCLQFVLNSILRETGLAWRRQRKS